MATSAMVPLDVQRHHNTHMSFGSAKQCAKCFGGHVPVPRKVQCHGHGGFGCILVMCVSVFKLTAFVYCFYVLFLLCFCILSAALCVSINE